MPRRSPPAQHRAVVAVELDEHREIEDALQQLRLIDRPLIHATNGTM
jgi:hypothetical protein